MSTEGSTSGAGDDGTCTYTHDLDGDTWDCPHDAEDGDLCVFHRPVTETPDGVAARAFLDSVNEAGRRCKQFVGARFGSLDVAFARIDAPDNHPVSLVDARIEGTLRLTSGAVTQPLLLDGVTVEGETVCENTTFGAECAAANVRFRGGVDFQGALFHERVRLQDATFGGPANFHAVEFDETADLEWTDFEGPADFARVDFGGDAVFTGARFAGTADFDTVTVAGKADFRGVRFGGASVFRDARFEGSVAFGDAVGGVHQAVEIDFHEGSRSTDPVFEFEGVFEHVDRRELSRTDERAVPDDAPHFGGEAEFADAEFVEEVHFEAPRFGTPPAIRDVTFRDPVVFRSPTVEGDLVDLRDSEVPAGTLGQTDDGTVVYDLEGATLGDVRVQGGTGAPFEHCRFVHTDFDGFDFGRYRDSIAAADWRIHTTLSGLDPEAPSLGDLEATYLKAKNGAKLHGDDKAAAEFFRQELSYRRNRYRRRVFGDEDLPTRLLSAARWSANALLKWSSGYGTRPSRVVLFALSVVFVCAPLFAVLRPERPYPSYPALGYLLLSFESFATGVRTGGPELTDPTVRLLMEIESFVGAFLIALFVFTLTRSINR